MKTNAINSTGINNPKSVVNGMDYDELISCVQDGRMTYLQYVMTSEHKHAFIDWLYDNNLEPSNETAQSFMEEVEKNFLQSQIMPQIMFV